MNNAVTDICISTKWMKDPVRRVVEAKISSTTPLLWQKGLDQWMEAIHPPLPCFFEETRSEYYMSEDGRRVFVIFEDTELPAYDDGC